MAAIGCPPDQQEAWNPGGGVFHPHSLRSPMPKSGESTGVLQFRQKDSTLFTAHYL